MIRDLYTQGTDSIHKIRVLNTYTVSYQYQIPKKFLEIAEREKKKEYLHACLNKRRNLTPFVALVDSLIGVEAEAILKRIASSLAQKWEEMNLRTCGYMNSRVEITLFRSNHQCI